VTENFLSTVKIVFSGFPDYAKIRTGETVNKFVLPAFWR
jgi:hypothetical protein